jgi:hypothetical protein
MTPRGALFLCLLPLELELDEKAVDAVSTLSLRRLGKVARRLPW